ncbi:MAG: aquaporin [Thermoplasmata archaeon]|nr:aquaporin [Thermoplasmata archaeon]MCI4337732.1 aquaporin [Thermoplasmata archaeon]MCI4340878.1 aquaporin [Thermoplasmata archaeon]
MRELARRALAELVGTALLVGIGTAAIVGGARAGGTPQFLLALAWFAAVTLPILLVASRSGAHLNPAVSLALVLSGRTPSRWLAPYILAQLSGAFLGSLVVWAALGPGAHLGATLPAAGQLGLALLAEAVFTALLVLSVFVVSDVSSRWGAGPLLLPGTVVGIATYLIGPLSGSSLNPARSIAPGLLSGASSYLPAYVAAVLGAAVVPALLWRRRYPAGR